MKDTDTTGTTDTTTPPHHLSWHMANYALALTFRILSGTRNSRSARCYGCSIAIAADHGHEVHQQSLYAGRSQIRYLCSQCFGPIKWAHEASNILPCMPLPPWWYDLTRTARAHDTRPKPQRPGPLEIDALLAEREGIGTPNERQPRPTPARRSKVGG